MVEVDTSSPVDNLLRLLVSLLSQESEVSLEVMILQVHSRYL